jgi:hypothetical protein
MFAFDQDRAKPEEWRSNRRRIQLEYDFEPLVLKPGEIVAKTMKLKENGLQSTLALTRSRSTRQRVRYISCV